MSAADTTPPRAPQPRGGISRRTLVAGTAWAVPAVVVAAAAPAAAASAAGCTYTFTVNSALSCQQRSPNPPGYKLTLTATRDLRCSSAPVTLVGTLAGNSYRQPDPVTFVFPKDTATATSTGFIATTNVIDTTTLSYTVGGVGPTYYQVGLALVKQDC